MSYKYVLHDISYSFKSFWTLFLVRTKICLLTLLDIKVACSANLFSFQHYVLCIHPPGPWPHARRARDPTPAYAWAPWTRLKNSNLRARSEGCKVIIFARQRHQFLLAVLQICLTINVSSSTFKIAPLKVSKLKFASWKNKLFLEAPQHSCASRLNFFFFLDPLVAWLLNTMHSVSFCLAFVFLNALGQEIVIFLLSSRSHDVVRIAVSGLFLNGMMTDLI